MRLRKKKWGPEIFEQFEEYVVADPENYKGKWRESLPCKKMHLEIGSGKGDYWHHTSVQFPEDGFVALEKDYTATAIALKKIEKYPNTNKKLILNDAKDLRDMFDSKEIDILHLNFSDPWPKLRHEKRRLTHASKLDIYVDILSDQGEIWLKTDNVGLFNYSLVSVSAHQFELIEVDVDFRASEQEDPMTEYERKFMSQGQPIFRAIWRVKRNG